MARSNISLYDIEKCLQDDLMTEMSVEDAMMKFQKERKKVAKKEASFIEKKHLEDEQKHLLSEEEQLWIHESNGRPEEEQRTLEEYYISLGTSFFRTSTSHEPNSKDNPQDEETDIKT